MFILFLTDSLATTVSVLHVYTHAQSGPSVKPAVAASSCGAALQGSLIEMAAWDWGGAVLCVEHCDDHKGPAPVKSFLPFDEELDAVRAAIESAAAAGYSTQIGVSVNWARSVLEAHDVARPLAHITAAGPVLRGLIFSGCSGAPAHPSYGVWQDSHMPFDRSDSGSLMTSERMTECIRAASAHGSLVFCGVKVTLQPVEADVAARIDVNRQMLDVVRAELEVK